MWEVSRFRVIITHGMAISDVRDSEEGSDDYGRKRPRLPLLHTYQTWGGDIRSGTTSDNRWHNVGEGEKFPRTLGTCLELPYTIGQLMLLPLTTSPPWSQPDFELPQTAKCS